MHDGCCLHRQAAAVAGAGGGRIAASITAGGAPRQRPCIGAAAAMIRVSSAGVRNISNAKGLVVNSFLGKLNCLPSSLSSTSTPSPSPSPSSWSSSLASSASEFTTSSAAALAAAVRERVGKSNFADRKNRNPIPAPPPPSRAPLLDVSAGGGERPRKPRQWRTKTKKGSIAKSEKLIEVVKRLPNSKEEVYGALDAWIAWDLEFPLIAVKKALKTLKDAEEWRRVIQVSKWMLDKGQGRTLATYQLLLQAFDHEGRIEEAEVLWEKVLRDNMECIPRTMFAQVINMYHRYGKYKEVLKIFADMDELQVKPEKGTIQKVAQAYEHYGYEEYGQSLLENYPSSHVEYKIIKGKKVRVRNPPNDEAPGSEQRIVEASSAVAAKEKPDKRIWRRSSEERRPSLAANNELRQKETSESRYGMVEPSSKIGNGHTQDLRPMLETTSDGAEERPKVGDNDRLEEVHTFEPRNDLEGLLESSRNGQKLVEVWPPLGTSSRSSSSTGSKEKSLLEADSEPGPTLEVEGEIFEEEIRLKEKPAYKPTSV